MSGDRAAGPAGTAADEPTASGSAALFVVDGDHTDRVLPLVCDLVVDADCELVLAYPVVLPEQTPLSMPAPRRQAERRVAGVALTVRRDCDGPPPTHHAVKVGHSRGRLLNDLVDRYDVSTVIAEPHPPSGLRSMLGLDGIDDVSLTTGCDAIIVPRVTGATDVDSVLVAVARGPHSGMAVEVGGALARRNDASLELLHVAEPGDAEAADAGAALLDRATDRVGPSDRVDRTLREAASVPECIVERSDDADITVLGAPREGLLRQFAFGSIPDAVSGRADGTVLITHRGDAADSWVDRWV